MLTRGRVANHLYLEVVGDGEPHNHTSPIKSPGPPPPTLILDREAGIDTALALSTTRPPLAPAGQHDLQLQMYACAGRREGLDVRAAYVHDLKAGTEHPCR